MKLPSEVNLNKYKPKSKEEVGFSLKQMSTVKNTSTYSYTPWSNWSSWNYNDKTVEDNSCSTTSTSLFDYEDDTLGDLTIPLNAYHDNWLGFSDSSWSTSVYRDLLKIESKKKLVGILSYESSKHKITIDFCFLYVHGPFLTGNLLELSIKYISRLNSFEKYEIKN